MSGKDDSNSLPYGLGVILGGYGLGGLLIVLGVVLMGLALYKGPDFANAASQTGAMIGGGVAGIAAIGLGLYLLRSLPASGTAAQRTGRHDVFIATPMAGYGDDEAGRKAAVELVNAVQAALRRLPGVSDVYTPVLSRPEAADYETPATAFDLELAALRSAKRYLLILPSAMPAGSSVLVTAGIAIALGVPTAVLAPEGVPPYLIDGAAQSKQVNLRVHHYQDLADIVRMIENDGLHLFGEAG